MVSGVAEISIEPAFLRHPCFIKNCSQASLQDLERPLDLRQSHGLQELDWRVLRPDRHLQSWVSYRTGCGMIHSRGKAIRSVKNARRPFLSGVPWGKDSTDPQNSDTQQAITSAIISEGFVRRTPSDSIVQRRPQSQLTGLMVHSAKPQHLVAISRRESHPNKMICGVTQQKPPGSTVGKWASGQLLKCCH